MIKKFEMGTGGSGKEKRRMGYEVLGAKVLKKMFMEVLGGSRLERNVCFFFLSYFSLSFLFRFP